MTASLFVGRWQPFHTGHKALIETVLKTGKPVVIGIRDTPIDKNNPFTANERRDMIMDALKEHGDLVRTVVLPDIDEVCYGRQVGYGLREIELDGHVQAISGTAERQKSPLRPIIWLCGQSGAGKTTLAKALAPLLGAVILDGDEMRGSISLGSSFDREGREEHNLRVARLAVVLAKQQPVIVAVIAPFEATRKKIADIAAPIWVHVDGGSYPFEPPQDCLAVSGKAAEKSAAIIIKAVKAIHG